MTRLSVVPLEDRTVPAALPPGFTESLFAAGLSQPTSMVIAPDGRVLVAEQTGGLRVVQNGATLPAPALTLAVDPQGERGLLGVELDPNFAQNGFVYLYYTVPAAGSSAPFNRVSRFTLSGNTIDPASERVLLNLDPLGPPTNHNGGALHFGPDGKLYVAVGDNNTGANSQSLSNRLGKLLRINPDGTIPDDNPTTFAGIAGSPTGANRAIWAVGLRNPFTFAVQPGTGRIFINDVGLNSAEEVNEGRPGANYGWPATEGDFDPAAFPAFTRPVASFQHGRSDFRGGEAITGGAFYNPTTATFPAAFVGDYFVTDLLTGWINRIDGATGELSNFATDLAGVAPVDLDVTADGDLIYLARGTGDDTGGIFRVRFARNRPVVAVGAGAGAGPAVALFDPATGASVGKFLAFEPTFAGGVRVAAGDVNGDGVPDVVAGAGPGGGPRVVVIDGATQKAVRDFFAFESTFTGGVYVAAADLDRDGVPDLIVSPDTGGGPRVRVVSGATGATIADFFAFESAFTGGVRVAAGDVNGDGVPDLVVAAGAGGGPRVAIFDGRDVAAGKAEPGRLVRDFFAFEEGLRNGAFVSAGDFDGDGQADLVLAAGPGGGPRVRVMNARLLLDYLRNPQNPGTLSPVPPVQDVRGIGLNNVNSAKAQIAQATLGDFFAGDPTDRRGVTVAAADADGDGRAEVVAAPAEGLAVIAIFPPPQVPAPRVTVHRLSGEVIREVVPFDAFNGGLFVG